MQVKTGLINVPLSNIQYEMYKAEKDKGVMFSQKEIELNFPVEDRIYFENDIPCLKFSLSYKKDDDWKKTKNIVAKGLKNIELLAVYYSNHRPVKVVTNNDNELIAIQDNGKSSEIMNIYDYGYVEMNKSLQEKLLEEGDRKKLKYYEELFEKSTPSINELNNTFSEYSLKQYQYYKNLTGIEKQIVEDIISQVESNNMLVDDYLIEGYEITYDFLNEMTTDNPLLRQDNECIFVDTESIVSILLINEYVKDTSINLEEHLQELSNYHITWHYNDDEVENMSEYEILDSLGLTDLLLDNSVVLNYEVLESAEALFQNYDLEKELNYVFENKSIFDKEECLNKFEKEFIGKSYIETNMFDYIKKIGEIEYHQFKSLFIENGDIIDGNKSFIADKNENNFELLKEINFDNQFGQDYLFNYINEIPNEIINSKLDEAHESLCDSNKLNDEHDTLYLTLIEHDINEFKYEIDYNNSTMVQGINVETKTKEIITNISEFIDNVKLTENKKSLDNQSSLKYANTIMASTTEVKNGEVLENGVVTILETGKVENIYFDATPKSEQKEISSALTEREIISEQINQLQKIGHKYTGASGFQFNITVDEVINSKNKESDNAMECYLEDLLKHESFDPEDKIALCTIVDEFQKCNPTGTIDLTDTIKNELESTISNEKLDFDNLIVNEKTKGFVNVLREVAKLKQLNIVEDKTFSR